MSEKIMFKNPKGEELSGNLFRGGMLDKSIVLFSNEKDKDSEFPLYNEIAQNLSNNNIPYFKFDYSGYGESQGDSLDFDIDKGVGDLQSAIELLDQKGYNKILLVGHGLGALIGLKSALKNKSIDSLCLVSPGSEEINTNEFINEIKSITNFVFILHGNNDKLHSYDFSVNLEANLINSDLLLMEGADNDFTHPRDYRKVVAYVLDFVFKNK